MPATTQKIFVGPSGEVAEGGRLIIDLAGLHVAGLVVGIFRFQGKLYAYENRCAHEGGPVCQGKIVPRVTEIIDEGGASRGFAFDEAHLHIVCPWHGYEYDIQTGVHPGKPSAKLRRVDVEENPSGIYVIV